METYRPTCPIHGVETGQGRDCEKCGFPLGLQPDPIPSWAHVPGELPEIRVDRTDYKALVLRLVAEHLTDAEVADVLRVVHARIGPGRLAVLLAGARAA